MCKDHPYHLWGKKSLAFLYKLAEETHKLEELCKQIIELTKRYEKEYLTKKE